MRRGNEGCWLKDEHGRVVLLNLGADFCAEHEWGIKGLRKAFGLTSDEKVFGVDRRKITVVPRFHKDWNGQEKPSLVFKEYGSRKKNPGAVLIFSDYGAEDIAKAAAGEKVEHAPYSGELRLHEFNTKYSWAPKDSEASYYTLGTAWDEKSFGVHVRGEGNVNQLREIYQAIEKKDLAIWLGGGWAAFKNAGLVLGIVSRISPENRQTMYDADKDHYDLLKASEATGIEKFLREKGKSWYALSPKWAKDFKDAKTAYPVIYWLNPQEQQIHNFGWFTVEDLKLWGDNQGPCMMKKKEEPAKK